MSLQNFLFTSESVSEGHPDKISDRISDAIVDKFLGTDPLSRVAVETLCTTNRIVLAGEVRGPDTITPEVMGDIARSAVKGCKRDPIPPARMTAMASLLRSVTFSPTPVWYRVNRSLAHQLASPPPAAGHYWLVLAVDRHPPLPGSTHAPTSGCRPDGRPGPQCLGGAGGPVRPATCTRVRLPLAA